MAPRQQLPKGREREGQRVNKRVRGKEKERVKGRERGREVRE